MNVAGNVTKVARKELEKNLNETVVSKSNYRHLTTGGTTDVLELVQGNEELSNTEVIARPNSQ